MEKIDVRMVVAPYLSGWSTIFWVVSTP